jgi:hypothetical protein
MKSCNATLVIAGLFFCSETRCSDSLSSRPSGARRGAIEVSASFEPLDPTGNVPPVVRVKLTSNRTIPAGIGLFAGSLSAHELKDLAAGEPSKNLVARQVPIVTWDKGGVTELAPTVPLETSRRHTISIAEWGWAQSFDVAALDGVPYLRRMWPPAEESLTGSMAIWCLKQPATGLVQGGATALEMWPGAVAGDLLQGAMGGVGQQCVSWRARGGEPTLALVPPPVAWLAEGQLVRLDPTPLRSTTVAGSAVEPACDGAQRPFGPGCAQVQDDRIILTTRASSWWIGIRSVQVQWTGLLDPKYGVVLRPLPQDSRLDLELGALDIGGREFNWTLEARTTAIQAHIVLNEIMANPAGPEPDQEWVELYNDGLESVQLEGWALEDSGGKSVLPPCELRPNQFALIVNDSYRLDSWLDRAPLPGTVIVRLTKLGTGGLSNAGEPLRLRNKQGETLSSAPAIASPKPSTALARVVPDALDNLQESFQFAPDGGTPGGPNSR